ncbi:MAG: hypothetical protein J2P28_07835 [Actinobacteria bacterium]|nr:hypothetical protein [Actinomycetota bacterium]
MMRETYARRETYAGDREKGTIGGGFLLVLISLVAAIAVIAGLVYAKGVGERRKALLAADGCAALPFQPTGLECTSVDDLVQEFKNRTSPLIQQLNASVAAYRVTQFRNLSAAQMILKAEVASEKEMDRRLARFTYTAKAAPIAQTMIRDNQTVVKLTAQQARATSLAQMQGFDGRTAKARAVVKADYARLLEALNAKPTAAQEP